VMFLVT